MIKKRTKYQGRVWRGLHFNGTWDGGYPVHSAVRLDVEEDDHVIHSPGKSVIDFASHAFCRIKHSTIGLHT